MKPQLFTAKACVSTTALTAMQQEGVSGTTANTRGAFLCHPQVHY